MSYKTPKAELLSKIERAGIIFHHAHGESPIAIAKLTGRHETTIRRFLQSPRIKKSVRTHIPNQILSERYVLYLRQVAVGTQKSAAEQKKELKLNVSVRRVQQILRKFPFFRKSSANQLRF